MFVINRSGVFCGNQFVKKLFLFLTPFLFVFGSGNLVAQNQIQVFGTTDADSMVRSILGKGLAFSNAKVTCPTGSPNRIASGTFQDISSNIGLNKGIVLTTGDVKLVLGPNNTDAAAAENHQKGDADLDAIMTDKSVMSWDGCSIEFDLVPSCDELKINYVFASEEYEYYVDKGKNDIFAFFVSGPGITGKVNIATVPNTNPPIPVSINSINQKRNTQYYVPNNGGKSIQFNSFTTPLKASIKVIPCKKYHLKIAIQDVGDGMRDSGVFIEGKSINCAGPDIVLPELCSNKSPLQVCGPSGYTYEWPANQPGAVGPLNKQCLTVNNPKVGDTYTVNIVPINDGCPGTATVKMKGADFTVRDTSVCTNGPSFPLTVIPLIKGNFTYKWSPATNLSNPNIQTPIFTPLSTQTYTVTMSETADPSCFKEKTVTVSVGSSIHVKTQDVSICDGATATLTAKGADSYIWQPGNIAGATIQVNPIKTTTYTVTGTSADANCPGQATAMAVVTVGQKVSVSAGADHTICAGSAVSLGGSLGGGSAKWSGGEGEFLPDRSALLAVYTPSSAEILAGSLILTLTTDSVDNCPVKTSQTVITINQVATAKAGASQVICQGSSVVLSGVVGGSALSGTWTSGEVGTFVPNNSANCTYKPNPKTNGKIVLTFTSNDPPGPCPAVSDTMSITIKQRPVADAGKPGEICENASISLSGKITGGSGYGTWSGGLGKYSPSDSSLITQYIPTAAEILAGKITFSLVTKSLGTCLGDTSMVTFIIHPNPVIQFSVDTAKACAPHCVDFTDNTAAGNTSINKWEWKFGEGMADQTKKNPKDVCFSKPGLYDVQLTATSSKNCISTLLKQSYIETYKQPKAAFIATPNPVSQFEPTIHFYNKSSADVKTWFWSLGDGTIISPSTKDPIHQYEVGVANVYNVWLVVKNAYGCMDSTSQAVEVQPEFTFFMPNAFTPSMDNDGINDTFFGKGRGIVDYKLWIFDRWGNMLFTAEDIDKGWDGRVKEKGGIALQDVYCWKVKLKDVFGNKHEYIGTVTLLQK